ncbi:MAG: hypothetical protein M3R25_13870 [Bacteroidota bacterium]|nr:hypothetical protein [Bacteroidota bacterium]
MKNFFLLFLIMMQYAAFSQTADLIFEIETFSSDYEHMDQIETAIGAHNKKYHPVGAHGVRVYNVVSGPNSGDYKWLMGPTPWSALDSRPDDDAHNNDWKNNVASKMEEGTKTEYIRYDPTRSRFPADFNLNKLFVRTIDVAKGKMDMAKGLLDKAKKVYTEKIPGQTFGVYFNELGSTTGANDIMIVYFFDKWAWMGEDDSFDAKYDEVYGKGSAAQYWTDWREAYLAIETEIWEYNEKLSGMPAAVKVAERQ